ncbi:MAG TPA: ankyrin repeat domain-containing protein [Vicinamibacterales bacterium]
MNPEINALAERAIIAGDVAALETLFRENEAVLRQGALEASGIEGLPPHFSSSDIKSIIAEKNNFSTWDEFAVFARERADESSPTARFEAAVDAIVRGDEATLDGLLRAHPELVHARSPRAHHSTLLLYVGANGVEGFRQKTPKNAARIAQRLIDAGANVNAVGDMYRGTTTIGLVATSVHPVTAGVQAEIIDVLMKAGASLDRAVASDYTDGLVVNACLANGRGEGAQIVAAHGATLDLEGAAGVGRLDVVKTFFDGGGRLKPNASSHQMAAGAFWACQYGHRDVVDYLLERGLDVTSGRRGETVLHGAALGGHPDIVRTLIARGAPIDVRDPSYRATPLGWAIWGLCHRSPEVPAERYYEVVGQLVAAGAPIEDDWLAEETISSDSKLVAALTRRDRA